MKTVAKIATQTGFVLELQSDAQFDSIRDSAAALRLIFPDGITAARYEVMLQIAGAWNVLRQLASGEGREEMAEPITSGENVQHGQGTSIGQPGSRLTDRSSSRTVPLPPLRLDIEILKLIDSMKPGPLRRAGLVGLLRPAFPPVLGDQLDGVLEGLARLKWVTLDTENGDFAFRLTERGVGALRMARHLGY